MKHAIYFQVLLLLMVLISGCGDDSPEEPDEQLTGEQKKLSEVMRSSSDEEEVEKPLSLVVGDLFMEWIQHDTSLSAETAEQFNKRLDSAVLKLSSRLFMETDPEKISGELNKLIFTTWGIEFDPDRNNARSLFPYSVLEDRKGSCVGMSLLYLLIAEKCDWPIFAVLAPSHMFVRFDNGSTRRNIETLRKGEAMNREWYSEKYSIRDTSIYPLTNLSRKDVTAVLHFNVGTLYYGRKEYDFAVTHLNKALNLRGDFPDAQGNLALAYEALEQPEKALKILKDLAESYPDFKNIRQNIASLQLRCGKYNDAYTSYSHLANMFVKDPDMYYGLAVALYRLNRGAEAEESVLKALELNPTHKAALDLKKKLSESSKS